MNLQLFYTITYVFSIRCNLLQYPYIYIFQIPYIQSTVKNMILTNSIVLIMILFIVKDFMGLYTQLIYTKYNMPYINNLYQMTFLAANNNHIDL